MKVLKPEKVVDFFDLEKNVPNDLYLFLSDNKGKEALEQLKQSHTPFDHTSDIDYEEKDHIYGFPIVTITMPKNPTQSKFYDAFLDNILKVPLLRGETKKKQYLMRYYLKILKVELLIIENIDTILDEVMFIKHNILSSIKHLQKGLDIPVLLVTNDLNTIDVLRVFEIEE